MLFDSARTFLTNRDGELVDVVSFGVESEWINLYRDYFSRMHEGRHDVGHPENAAYVGEYANGIFAVDFVDDFDDTDFLQSYLVPQGIRYALGCRLHDGTGSAWATICLERNRLGNFTEYERRVFSLAAPHVDNLARNLLTIPPRPVPSGFPANLTPREREVALLLRAGKSPGQAAEWLGISRKTVYVHVNNLHRKLGVSTAPELMLALLGDGGDNA